MKGSIVALVTPFKNGEVDYNALERLIDFHLNNQTDGIVLLGTTAESATLASDEKENLLRFAMQKINKKLPVIIGTGSNNLSITVSNTLKAEKFGADAALIVTPYYNKPTQEGLYQYYKEIVAKTTIPIILYNVPGRTACNLSAETTIRLANDFPGRIIGTKEASGDLVQAGKIIKHTADDFFLLSGEDALNLPLMCIGAKGTISVTANIVPKLMHDLIQAALDNNYPKAQEIHLHLIELNQIMFVETSPTPVKTALAFMNLIENEVRLPLCPLTESNQHALKNCIKNYHLI